ncbi:MAG: hypothetical protein AABX16_03230 [Nanoarchaeota archaeon]|mgnify:CR=1 FL=1
MKQLVLIIISIFLALTYISAENVTLDYPAVVNAGEEFSVTVYLINFSDGDYDLKFEIMNSSKHIAKRFWENNWKSTNYWMNEAFTNGEHEKKFTLMIHEEFEGNVEIITKVRHEKKVSLFGGNFIMVQRDEKNTNKKTGDQAREIDAHWNKEEIINGNIFTITLDHLPPENRYDVRVWIETEYNIISERYDSVNDDWKSGMFYINDLHGEEQKITIRMQKNYQNFSGKAHLIFKVRDWKETWQNIIVLPSMNNTNDNKTIEKIRTMQEKNNSREESIIFLNTTVTGKIVSKTEEAVAYESVNEHMKQYALFGFAFVCVMVCLLLVWKKLE